MSKALVIKGANFAVNKVETITITEVVPCTGISLSDSSYAFTTIGATKTLTATATPADTTEPIIWSSSNTNCATVENGVVTCVGVGSATITAYCGEHSATCAVTATVTIDANTELTGTDGYGYTSTDLDAGKDYVGIAANAKRRIYLSEEQTATGYKAITSQDSTWDSFYPIMIPTNTQKITISVPDGFNNRVSIELTDSTTQPTYNVSGKGVRAITNAINNFWSATERAAEFDLTDYSGFDSFVFYAETKSANASTITGDVTIVFS